MSYKETFYPESIFGGYTDIDGTLVFYARINALLSPEFTVLDVGCGRGAYKVDPVTARRNLRIIKGKVKKVIGIDVDSFAGTNPYIDEFIQIYDNGWDVVKNSIDLIICDSVLEHIAEPDLFYSEVFRVLRNGGYLCIRTANSWNYITFFSKFIPNKHHSRVLKRVQDHRSEEDVFPTHYRCNTITKLRSLLNNYGNDHVVYGCLLYTSPSPRD